jgi:hypothetical protein
VWELTNGELLAVVVILLGLFVNVLLVGRWTGRVEEQLKRIIAALERAGLWG